MSRRTDSDARARARRASPMSMPSASIRPRACARARPSGWSRARRRCGRGCRRAGAPRGDWRSRGLSDSGARRRPGARAFRAPAARSARTIWTQARARARTRRAPRARARAHGAAGECERARAAPERGAPRTARAAMAVAAPAAVVRALAMLAEIDHSMPTAGEVQDQRRAAVAQERRHHARERHEPEHPGRDQEQRKARLSASPSARNIV